MEDYPFSMLITALLLIGNVWLASRVSDARGKFAQKKNSEGFDHSAQIYTQTDFMHIFRNHLFRTKNFEGTHLTAFRGLASTKLVSDFYKGRWLGRGDGSCRSRCRLPGWGGRNSTCAGIKGLRLY